MKTLRLKTGIPGMALAMICAGLLAGCAWSIGDREGSSRVQPTRGQELIDLKRAQDSGAITPEEYELQKKRILER